MSLAETYTPRPIAPTYLHAGGSGLGDRVFAGVIAGLAIAVPVLLGAIPGVLNLGPKGGMLLFTLTTAVLAGIRWGGMEADSTAALVW